MDKLQNSERCQAPIDFYDQDIMEGIFKECCVSSESTSRDLRTFSSRQI